MMCFLIIGHLISYFGVNIDHYRTFIIPFLLFFPILFISVFLKPRKNGFKYIPLWMKLLIAPIVLYLVLLIHASSQHDQNFSSVADVIDGQYVLYNHGIVSEIISLEYYDQLRSYFYRLSTAGVFLFYFIVTLGTFSKYKQRMVNRKV